MKCASCEQNQIYSGFAEAEYLRHSQSTIFLCQSAAALRLQPIAFTAFCHRKAVPKVFAGHLRRDRTAVLTERAQNDVQQASAEAVRGLCRAAAVEAAQSFAPQRRSLS